MADDKYEDDQQESKDEFGTGPSDEADDFGALSDDDSSLGNLPPLSDFESSDGGSFDSNLPPLSGMDSDSGGSTPKPSGGSVGGLPPISDIPVETPLPESGGLDTPTTPASPATPAFDAPTSQHADTPTDSTGFQDLTADSDFTPETPEVAPPGPESDIETPMFDSAFGADSSAFSGAADTSAPTQAMETPMFGANPQAPAAGIGDQGFDADAFGAGMDAGTPAPDFSPDTVPPAATPATMTGMDDEGGGGRGGVLVGVGALVVGAIIGIVAGPFAANSLAFLPNPAKTEIQAKDDQISQLQSDLATARREVDTGVSADLTPDAIEELRQQRIQLTEDINQGQAEKEAIVEEVGGLRTQLDEVRADLEQTNEEFVTAKADYDQLVKETSITLAQKQGLDAEVDRLQILTGRLEDANLRRLESVETLRNNIRALSILVSEGNPLVPEKYSRQERMDQVADLSNRAEAAKWVTPSLLDEYTDLYKEELAISQQREYFFATVPIVDRFGTRGQMPAECLMNGNWGTYYRTLDGEHIGVYSNVADGGSPNYRFQDAEDPAAMRQIEEQIFNSRVQGYEAMLDALVQKHLIIDDKGEMQKRYDSL
jgi:uncharacterized coiled-coil DUF342 family protein